MAEERQVEFSRWLRVKRVETGLTQKGAAQKAGMDYRQWSRYEKGQPAHRSTVIRLAEAVGASRDEALMVAGYLTSDPVDLPNGINLTGAMLQALADLGKSVSPETLIWIVGMQKQAGFPLDETTCLLLLTKHIEQYRNQDRSTDS